MNGEGYCSVISGYGIERGVNKPIDLIVVESATRLIASGLEDGVTLSVPYLHRR